MNVMVYFTMLLYEKVKLVGGPNEKK